MSSVILYVVVNVCIDFRVVSLTFLCYNVCISWLSHDIAYTGARPPAGKLLIQNLGMFSVEYQRLSRIRYPLYIKVWVKLLINF